jgi:hypothetical protein
MKIKVGAVSPSIKGDRFEVMRRYVEGQDLDLIVFPEEFLGQISLLADQRLYQRKKWFKRFQVLLRRIMCI